MKAARLACVTAIATAPIIGGSIAAARLIPNEVNYAPGLSADVSLKLSDTTTIEAGVLGSIHFEGVSAQLPLIGNVSPNIRMHEIGVSLTAGSNTFDQYIGLFADPQTAIIEPTKQAVQDRLLDGAVAAGTGEAVLLGGYLAYSRRRRTHDEKSEPADQDSRSQSGRNRPGSVLIGAALATSLLAACATDTLPVSGLVDTPPLKSVPLNQSITDRASMLRGATVTGIGGDLINTAAASIDKQISKTDQFWKQAHQQYKSALANYRLSEPVVGSSEAGLIPVLQLSDIHCNYAYVRTMVQDLVTDFGIRVVINVGDTYMTTGSSPLESGCLQEVLKQIKPDKQDGHKVVMLDVRGNHDPVNLPGNLLDQKHQTADGESFKPLIVLDEDNKYRTNFESLTFVGSPDLLRSTIDGTLPSDRDEQAKLLEKQEEIIADTACAVTQETGTAPITLAHNPEALQETLDRGCTSTAYSGHTHDSLPSQIFNSPVGRQSEHRELGSSSGAPAGKTSGITITQYAAPASPAVASVQYLQPLTGRVVRSVDITISPEGKASIVAVPGTTIAQQESLTQIGP